MATWTDDPAFYQNARDAGAFEKSDYKRQWVSFMQAGKLYKHLYMPPSMTGPMMFIGFTGDGYFKMLDDGEVQRYLWQKHVDPTANWERVY